MHECFVCVMRLSHKNTESLHVSLERVTVSALAECSFSVLYHCNDSSVQLYRKVMTRCSLTLFVNNLPLLYELYGSFCVFYFLSLPHK